MPVMDGPECISHIRNSAAPWRDIPVIAFTAEAMAGDRERFIAMGMTDYLSKPINRDALLRMVEAVLGATPATIVTPERPGTVSEVVDLGDVLMDIESARKALVA